MVTNVTNMSLFAEPRWMMNACRWQEVESLANSLHIPQVVAAVLVGRGLTDPKEARAFVACEYRMPDPFLFSHMERAVCAITRAIEERRRIVVHGDYDADGITATAAMLLGLQSFGIKAEWYLPNRFAQGYGLSAEAVRKIAAEGPALLLTVDCGVNYPDEVELAKQLGLEVVVIDHHQLGDRLPDCAVIHPSVGDYPHSDLCGVGLVLKVLHALHLRCRGCEPTVLPQELYELLDLVAVGTIADLAPLRGENRLYVREGLKLLTIGQRVGLRALAAVAGCEGAVDSAAVAYRIAPRLNAAGRLVDPAPPLLLLLSESETQAQRIAQELHELNGARQDVERRILEEALGQVEAGPQLPAALVVAGEGWHEGVVGIVASRLVERYGRPAIVLGIREGVAKGSGRSIPAYDLMEGLRAAQQLLTVYGGHKQAAGLTLPCERLGDFRLAIQEHASRALSYRDLVPSLRIDAVLLGEEITADVAQALAELGPFGTGNPRPRLLMVDAGLDGAELTRNGSHVRFNIVAGGAKVRGVGFNLADKLDLSSTSEGRWALAVQLRADEWQGVVRPEVTVQGLKRTDGAEERWKRRCDECRSRAGMHSERLLAEGACLCTVDSRASEAVVSRWSGLVRDYRDQSGNMGRVAQILATGQTVLLLSCAVAWRLPELAGRLPLDVLTGRDEGAIGCLCQGRAGKEAREPGVSFADWHSAEKVMGCGRTWEHVVVLDPPFRPRQVTLVEEAAREGALAHLCYGANERAMTLRYLRYSVHPRFAMVCLYRSFQQGPDDEVEWFTRAAALAWREARVVLTERELTRSRLILEELGVLRSGPIRAKLEARAVPAYAAAEADYEECVRLCRSL